MPIIKTHSKLIYFAHVPKCGGASVDEYLIKRFGSQNIGFLDSRFSNADHVNGWNKTSPQHITYVHRQQIMPDAIFDHQFAVVRHPMNRVISMFKFNGRRLRGQTFTSWLLGLERLRKENPYYLDNHPRPSIEIVPPGAKVFKLEDGLDAILPWVDKILGSLDPNNLKIAHVNKSPQQAPDVVFNDGDVEMVYELYKKDYRHFGYKRDDYNV
jgi:hypothetical protein